MKLICVKLMLKIKVKLDKNANQIVKYCKYIGHVVKDFFINVVNKNEQIYFAAKFNQERQKLGLSSSQARLLNLTARMHDIEYKAQNLEAQKLQMANESSHVYQEYENALNKTKVQFKNISADGSIKYEDADIPTLLEKGYRVKIYNGSTWVNAQ